MEAYDIPLSGIVVTLSAATGIAGLSIEDSTGDLAHPLHAFDWWSHVLWLRDTPSTQAKRA